MIVLLRFMDSVRNYTWKFNVFFGIHNHYICHKLVIHPIVCRLNHEEKLLVSGMTLNMVPPKNILETLKQKRSQNISNIKQIYNVRVGNNKAMRGLITEIQHMLKLLDDDHDVRRYV